MKENPKMTGHLYNSECPLEVDDGWIKGDRISGKLQPP